MLRSERCKTVQKHANLVDLVKSFPTHIFLQIWRRYRRERALESLISWLKNQMKVRHRTFQLRQHAVSWSIAKSLATEETDRVRLLNAVCEEADLDRVPSIASPAYDALDASA